MNYLNRPSGSGVGCQWRDKNL